MSVLGGGLLWFALVGPTWVESNSDEASYIFLSTHAATAGSVLASLLTSVFLIRCRMPVLIGFLAGFAAVCAGPGRISLVSSFVMGMAAGLAALFLAFAIRFIVDRLEIDLATGVAVGGAVGTLAVGVGQEFAPQGAGVITAMVWSGAVFLPLAWLSRRGFRPLTPK
jgi:ammonia channel protein AmtB